jgi:hypothetical protein
VDGFVLFCEPCFETFDVLYKREIRPRVKKALYLKMKWRIKPKDDDARASSEQTTG